jgi:peptidylprolyl isomerase/FKBP-type peptidyl-prolyl cis-trans isomerase FkpA
VKRSLVVLLVAGLAAFAGACGDEADSDSGGDAAAGPEEQECLVTEDLEEGDGDEATAGSVVTVHYTGTLEDGTEFDSSRQPGRTPFKFPLGAGNVIQGWDQGVEGMREGGVRKLTICSDLAYGEQGFPPTIPGGATLIFEVELLKVRET